MNHKRLASLCCALLLSFAGLFLSSCATTPPTIIVSHGTPSLMRHQVVKTVKKIKEQKPATVQQMSELLGAPPLSEYTDKKGRYCLWRSYEESKLGGTQTSRVMCLANKDGGIEKLYIHYFPRPFEDGLGKKVEYGDLELDDPKIHPGCDKAWKPVFQEETVKRGFAYGKEVVFSPSGFNAVFLPHGAYVKGWVNETANICYPTPQEQPQQQVQQQAPAQQPAQQQSGVKTILDTANTTIKLIRMFSGN